MDLSNAKPGELYYLWLTVHNLLEHYSVSSGHKKCACTVIGVCARDYVLVGWNKGELMPADSLRYSTSASYPILPGHLDPFKFERIHYVWKMRWAEFIQPSLIATSDPMIVKRDIAISSGAKCRKCGEYNEYAVSDKPDGTFICYGCRR